MEMTAASLCWGLLTVCVLLVSADRQVITAEIGHTATLSCQAPVNKNVMAVEWSRADLEAEYVLLYQDGQFLLNGQDPSFKDRVDLQDHQMKDGDVSLILKDVTTDDTGIYECRIVTRGTNRTKRVIFDGEPISIVYLSVLDLPGERSGGFFGLRFGLQLPTMVIVAVFLCCIYRKHKRQKRHSSYSHV